MGYKKTIKDNILTIENLHKDPLYVKIFIDKYCCNQCRDCQDCSYELASEHVLGYCEKNTLTLADGSYNIVLTDSSENVIDTFEIKVYTELRAEVIDLFFKKFCENSECGPCGGSSNKGDCKELAYKALLKDPIVIESILTYAMLKGYASDPVFTSYLQAAFDFYRCGIVANDCNQRKYLKFFGKYNKDYDLFGKLASVYISGFYLMEKLEENESNLDSIYRIYELKKCINKYGIVYDKLEDVFVKQLQKGTTKPIVKNQRISIDLNAGCNSEGETCIDGSLFIDQLNRSPSTIRIVSAPTSGELYIKSWNNEKILVSSGSEYEIPIIPGNCAFLYVPTEISNLENPFDSFTFEVKVEQVLFDKTVKTDFSNTAVVEIFTNTLTGRTVKLNNVTVTGNTVDNKMVLLSGYMKSILGSLNKENLEFIRVDNITHSNNVFVQNFAEGIVYDMKEAENQELFFGGRVQFPIQDISQNSFLFIKFSFKEKCSKYWWTSADKTPFIFYNLVNDGSCKKSIWGDSGEKGCSTNLDNYIPIPIENSEEPIWENSGESFCSDKNRVIRQKDVNPNSSTFGVTRKKILLRKDPSCNCEGEDTTPNFQTQGEAYCKGEDLMVLKKDINPCSETFGITKEVVSKAKAAECTEEGSDLPIWTSEGESFCKGKNLVILQRNTNPRSDTYNTTREYVVELNAERCNCEGKSTTPIWTKQEIYQCSGSNYQQQEKDTNPCSASFNNTRWTTISANGCDPNWTDEESGCYVSKPSV